MSIITVEDAFSCVRCRVIEGATADDAVVAYQRSGGGYGLYVKIVTSIGGKTVGSQFQYGTSSLDELFDVCRLNSTYAVAVWSQSDIYADLWDISGSTVSEATDDLNVDSTFNAHQPDVACCMASDTKVFAVGHNDLSGRLYELGRSGSTLSVTSADDITLTKDSRYDIAYLGSDKVIIAYFDSSDYPTVTVVDASSGISQGSAVNLESSASTSNPQISVVALSSTLAVCAYRITDASGAVKLAAMTISGTTPTVGTPITTVGASSSVSDKSLAKIDSDTCLLGCSDNGVRTLKVYDISGTTPSFVSSATYDDYSNWQVAVFSDGSYQIAGQHFDVYLETVGSSVARFYQGTNTLTERASLPFTAVNPDGLDVGNDGAVYAGYNQSGTAQVAKATDADTYGSWTDLTDSLTDAAKSVRRVE